MKRSWSQMGMPITLEIVDERVTAEPFGVVRDYFTTVDETFSTYKPASEISRINRNELPIDEWSPEVKKVLELCDETRQATDGYFDIRRDGVIDPSGLVKGWAINQAAKLLHKEGFKSFCLEVGGDIQVSGRNRTGQHWRIGLRNPFNASEIVKTVTVGSGGVATSGTAERGAHIYNPRSPAKLISEVISLTVIGPNIYEADRFATAAFAMGRAGIDFIERLAGFEGYMIDNRRLATLTSGFERYVVTP